MAGPPCRCAVLGGDDHVAATQQRRVAGKAAPRHDAEHRHLAIQAREAGKSAHMQPGHDRHIDVTGATAAAFGEEHDRQFLLQAIPSMRSVF